MKINDMKNPKVKKAWIKLSEGGYLKRCVLHPHESTLENLERLKQEQSALSDTMFAALDGDNDAIMQLFDAANCLLGEKIEELNRSFEAGLAKGDRSFKIILNLAMEAHKNALQVDPVFRDKDYDPWQMTVSAVLGTAKDHGVKDKRTVLNLLNEQRVVIEEFSKKWNPNNYVR